MISNRNIGDQEVEYIYGMAFVENMVDLRKRKDFSTYTPHPTQKLLISAITDLEQLKATLTKRYEDAKKTTKNVENPKEAKALELNELLPARKTTEIDDELARKEAQIAALNKQRAELELENAMKKKENEELDKKRFSFEREQTLK